VKINAAINQFQNHGKNQSKHVRRYFYLDAVLSGIHGGYCQRKRG